jgi:hypothetical protein
MSFWSKVRGKSQASPAKDLIVPSQQEINSEVNDSSDAIDEPKETLQGHEGESPSAAPNEQVSEAQDNHENQSVEESSQPEKVSQDQPHEQAVSDAQGIERSDPRPLDLSETANPIDSTPTPAELAEKARLEAEAHEKQLQEELAEAEAHKLAQQLDLEKEEILEDLLDFDGRIMPELKVPNWREELEFVKERYEPCDLSDHIVKVSKRRLTSRQIDHELSQSRLNAYERYLERASRRFKDKIDEDALLHSALTDLSQWRSEQGKSVAWLFAERVNEEVLKAKDAETAATSFVENNSEFSNPHAIEAYRHFARRLFLIPLATMYIMSVVGLTYSHFSWILKFLPFFNLGLSKTLFIIAGVPSYFMIANFWRYSKQVAKIQKQLNDFNEKYQEQDARIKHAVKEHTRLSQQQPMVEPILHVLAKAYRVQLQSNVFAKIQTTTEFDPASLPACVTLARAISTEEEKIARLKRRALNILMTPGWRTNGLNDIARIHAESRMLDAHSLSLSSLDNDSMVSATSAQKILLEAFSNTSIHDRVSRERLIKAIKEIHREVLANWASDDRPRVASLRDFGFDKIAFRTSWLAEDDGSEPWIPFLTELLGEETAPFGLFNILDKRSELNMADRISSVAVVPHYFSVPESKVRIEQSKSTEVMPLDVVVRVDVSPWSEPNAFAVFADDIKKISETLLQVRDEGDSRIGGLTGA